MVGCENRPGLSLLYQLIDLRLKDVRGNDQKIDVSFESRTVEAMNIVLVPPYLTMPRLVRLYSTLNTNCTHPHIHTAIST